MTSITTHGPILLGGPRVPVDDPITARLLELGGDLDQLDAAAQDEGGAGYALDDLRRANLATWKAVASRLQALGAGKGVVADGHLYYWDGTRQDVCWVPHPRGGGQAEH